MTKVKVSGGVTATVDLLSVDELAAQIALMGEILASRGTPEPVRRWLQYQAYRGFIEYLRSRDEIPDAFGEVYMPGEKEVRDWIAGRGRLRKRLETELRRLLEAMQAAGSKVVEELCSFYCAYKKAMKVGGDAAAIMMNVAQIKAILVAYTRDMLYFGGVPITAFAALLLHSGLLEKICECPEE